MGVYIQNLREATWRVQSMASWCIGTAVKNVEEFYSWGLEDLSDLVYQSVDKEEISDGVSVISILLNRLEAVTAISSDPWVVESPSWLKMKQKDLYALGALLRGNKDAIHYFNYIDGPSTLSDVFHKLTSTSGNSILSNAVGVKLLSRIMILGVDLLADLSSMQNDAGGNFDKSILEALTTQEWCSMPIITLSTQSTNIQRQTVEAMAQMSSHCDFAKDITKIDAIIEDPEIKDLLKSVELRTA